MSIQADDYDSPWKDILERYLADFLAFFFPHAHTAIDWSLGYTFLDKELQAVMRDAELGRRLADKLVQVWRRDGQESWVLIHIEVQSQDDAEFAERMFVYHYRLFDRYRRQVVSLAVLSDERDQWRPESFGYNLWGCELHFRFPIVKLLDYRMTWAALEASHNPFATVVMAHLTAQETRRDANARAQAKFALIRRLYELGYSRVAVIDLFHFIDWVMRLPKDLDAAVWREIQQLEEEKNVTYITSVEQLGREEGLKVGRAEGLIDGITLALEIRFGDAAATLIAEIRQITDLAVLEQLLTSVRSATTPDDVRRVYAPTTTNAHG